MRKLAMAMSALTACATTTTACASTALTACATTTATTETTETTDTAPASRIRDLAPAVAVLDAKSTAKVELRLTPSNLPATFAVVDGALLWSSRRMRTVGPEWQPWTCFDGALVVDGAVVQSGRPVVKIEYITPIVGPDDEWVSIRWKMEAPAVAALRSATSTTPVTMRFCQHEYVIENVSAVQALLAAHDPQPGL